MGKSRKLKIGVIGCGAISVRRHLPEYAENENVEITAVYNRTRSKAVDIQKLYGGVVCDSVEELAAMDLDAVSVCTANAMHAHDTILALRAGKHVLCEKPMDVTIEKCTATLDKRYPDGNLIDVEDNAWCIYRTDSGITGTMHASWTNYGHEYNSIVIHGTKGIICGVHYDWKALQVHRGRSA